MLEGDSSQLESSRDALSPSPHIESIHSSITSSWIGVDIYIVLTTLFSHCPWPLYFYCVRSELPRFHPGWGTQDVCLWQCRRYRHQQCRTIFPNGRLQLRRLRRSPFPCDRTCPPRCHHPFPCSSSCRRVNALLSDFPRRQFSFYSIQRWRFFKADPMMHVRTSTIRVELELSWEWDSVDLLSRRKTKLFRATWPDWCKGPMITLLCTVRIAFETVL